MIQSYVTIKKTTVNKCCEASKVTLTQYNLFCPFLPLTASLNDGKW